MEQWNQNMDYLGPSVRLRRRLRRRRLRRPSPTDAVAAAPVVRTCPRARGTSTRSSSISTRSHFPEAYGCGSKPMGFHFRVGAPPILEPILVGIGMFTGGILTHGHMMPMPLKLEQVRLFWDHERQTGLVPLNLPPEPVLR